MKAVLKKVKCWTEKDNDQPELESKGYLRIYVGSLFVGHAIPARKKGDDRRDLYEFDSAKGLYHIINMGEVGTLKGRELQEILDDVELAFKELLKKIAE